MMVPTVADAWSGEAAALSVTTVEARTASAIMAAAAAPLVLSRRSLERRVVFMVAPFVIREPRPCHGAIPRVGLPGCSKVGLSEERRAPRDSLTEQSREGTLASARRAQAEGAVGGGVFARRRLTAMRP